MLSINIKSIQQRKITTNDKLLMYLMLDVPLGLSWYFHAEICTAVAVPKLALRWYEILRGTVYTAPCPFTVVSTRCWRASHVMNVHEGSS